MLRSTENVLKCLEVLQDNIRLTILKALFSEPFLYDELVLKGGNALALVYGVGGRSSLDLDFSIREDFKDIDVVSAHIKKALLNAFAEQGVQVFDFGLRPKPTEDSTPWWGGYLAEFKLIADADAKTLNNDLDQMRRRALTINPGNQRRKYRVEISKFEYVDDSVSARLDDVDIRVYSPVLLAAEKLRALIQQHPKYTHVSPSMKRSRSRDLFDIWALSDHFAIRLQEHYDTVLAVFAAKRVAFDLLGRFRELFDFHRADWASVEIAVPNEIEAYEFYFDFVALVASDLYSKWIVDAP